MTDLKTPEEVAEDFWELDDSQQGQFFAHLLKIAGEQDLMSQMLWCRQACEKENREGLDGFQVVASAAYKYLLGDHLK